MKRSIYSIPNLLTLFRLVFIPIIVYGIFNDLIISIIFFALSNITDILDGYVARKLKQETDFGEYFDFVADFIAIYAILISLIIKGIVSALNAYLLMTATVFLVGIAIILSVKAKRAYMPHRISSKTLAILVSLSFYMFFFNFIYANHFLLFSFIIIYAYTIPDYVILTARYKH